MTDTEQRAAEVIYDTLALYSAADLGVADHVRVTQERILDALTAANIGLYDKAAHVAVPIEDLRDICRWFDNIIAAHEEDQADD